MEVFFIVISVIVQLAILGAIIYAVWTWRRRSTTSAPDTGVGTPRRFYFYSISFIALMLLASGVWMLLMSLLDELFGEPVIRGSTTRLATGLALTIVGLPLWALHWRFTQRSADTHLAESRSILRKLYLYAASGVALGFLAYNGYRVIEWVFRASDEFSALTWAAIPVWATIWAYHWRVASVESPETTTETRAIRRFYLYLASAAGVAMLAGGLGSALYFVLREGYTAAFAADLLVGAARDDILSSLSVAIVGAVIWWTHWLKFAGDDRGSVLRWIYLFTASIGGGIIPALVGCGLAAHTLLSWLLGASTNDASTHFEVLPDAVATTAAGIGMWGYHRLRLTAETVQSTPGDAFHVSRVYDVLISTIGLFALTAASVAILDMFLRLIADTSPVVVGSDAQWRSALATTLTLLLIGLPVWGARWRRIQAAAAADPEVERTAIPRKLYVMGVLCLSLLALVGGASSTLFIFFRDLLDANLSSATLRDLATAFAIVLTTALVIPYHWVVYRQDRELEPDDESPAPVRKHVTLLTPPGGEDFAQAVAESLGYSITPVPWSDPDAYVPALNPDELACVALSVTSAPGSQVLLIPEPTTLRVISHD